MRPEFSSKGLFAHSSAFSLFISEIGLVMMCIVIIAQYADCTPCGFGSRQKVRSVVHPRAAILHFDGSG